MENEWLCGSGQGYLVGTNKTLDTQKYLVVMLALFEIERYVLVQVIIRQSLLTNQVIIAF
jgi:hypothetical protein